jgi:hypothetical protein
MILDRKKLLFEVEMSTMDGEGGKKKGEYHSLPSQTEPRALQRSFPISSKRI